MDFLDDTDSQDSDLNEAIARSLMDVECMNLQFTTE